MQSTDTGLNRVLALLDYLSDPDSEPHYIFAYAPLVDALAGEEVLGVPQ